jgi:ubiquinone biosynthesis protein Coq4
MFSFPQNLGNCFPACNSNTAATVEGTDLCKLTKSIDELADLLKAVIITDLTAVVPVLADIFKTVNAFFKDPMSGIGNMAGLIQDIHSLGYVFNSTMKESQQILHDVNDIVTTSIHLVTKLIAPQ